MKTKDRLEKLAQRVPLTFRSSGWERRGNADLKVCTTQLNERSWNVIENKGALLETVERS